MVIHDLKPRMTLSWCARRLQIGSVLWGPLSQWEDCSQDHIVLRAGGQAEYVCEMELPIHFQRGWNGSSESNWLWLWWWASFTCGTPSALLVVDAIAVAVWWVGDSQVGWEPCRNALYWVLPPASWAVGLWKPVANEKGVPSSFACGLPRAIWLATLGNMKHVNWRSWICPTEILGFYWHFCHIGSLQDMSHISPGMSTQD